MTIRGQSTVSRSGALVKALGILFVLALVASISPLAFNFDTEAEAQQAIPSEVNVLMDDSSIETMDLDEYVKGVVAGEMYPDWPIEALKAQAVAARTFAVANSHHDHVTVDVCTDPNCCQAWVAPPYNTAIVEAVTSTHNQVITYNDEIITEALYHGHCDGHTRDPQDLGWSPQPYLVSVACDCGYTFHSAHGVGMCQYGAKAMAEQGSTYIDILTHYYTGVEITAASPTPTPTPDGEGCFIATAAYGTSTTEEIDTLRSFRDEVLLESRVGSHLVEWYYQTSPPVADFISENDVLKTLVRELLVDPISLVVEATETLWRN
jgi:hypothetical protein